MSVPVRTQTDLLGEADLKSYLIKCQFSKATAKLEGTLTSLG